MEIKELLNKGINILKQNEIDDYNIKARLLLQHVLNKDKNYIIMNFNKEVDKETEYIKYINEIATGKPLQYITNKQEFMKLIFYVDENVLIPQPDTEILVEETIKEIERSNCKDIRILDLCTGSGAIAISIAKYLEENKKECNAQIFAIDVSNEALEIAKRNANTHNVKIEFILSNMFEQIPKEKFDFIISNPPYIESKTIELLSKEVKHEPHIALDGGRDGLKFYREIARDAINHIKVNGKILLEIGFNQREKVIQIFDENSIYKNIECIRDLSNNNRVIKIHL